MIYTSCDLISILMKRVYDIILFRARSCYIILIT